MRRSKSFSERSPVALGAAGIAVILALVAAALGNQKLPFLNNKNNYTAYFADSGGLFAERSVTITVQPGLTLWAIAEPAATDRIVE